MPVGAARDLRQVGDRDHLRAARRAAQRLGDAVGGRSADAGVDLVEDHRLAAADRGDRERDAGELAAGRGLGHRARTAGPRSAGSGTRASSAPRRARLALAQLDGELAVAHPHALRAPPATASANGRRRRRARVAQLPGDLPYPRLGSLDRLLARPRPDRRPGRAPRARSAPPRHARAAPRATRTGSGRFASAIRSSSASTSSSRPGRPRATTGRSAARSPPRAAAARRRAARPPPSGAPARAARRARVRARPRREPGRAVALVGVERLRGGRGALQQLGHVPQPLALLAERVLQARLQPVRVLHERAQLGQPRLAGGRIAGQLLVPPPGGDRARARPRVPRPADAAAPRRRTRRGRRAGRSVGRAGAARTDRTSPAAARRARPRPRGPRCAPRHTRASAPRRRSAGRATTPSSSSGRSSRERARTPPRRAGPPGGRTRPRRRPRPPPAPT